MAVTKIKAVKSTLGKAVRYIENPEKTEFGLLVSTYNCSADHVALDFALSARAASERMMGRRARDDNLAYHLIQSFSPNDPVTPEQAHEIGRQLADRFLKGEFEYVISTHVDKHHVHNHILINATSWLTGQKLRTRPYQTAQQIRAISDQLCIAHELSVIQNPGRLRRSYAEWRSRKQGGSWKAEIRKRLNFVLARADSYDQFLALCGKLDVAVDDSGNHIKYRLRGMERWARGCNLADTEHFTIDGIQAQLKENAEVRQTLLSGIRAEIGQSADWDDFLNRLDRNHGIRITQGKTGLIYHTPDELRRKASELGAAFQQEQLLHALRDRSYSPGDAPTTSIREQWEEYIAGRQRDVTFVPLVLRSEDVDRISLDGLLLRLSTKDGEQSFFVDSDHVDFDPLRNTYTAYIASAYSYFALRSDIDPDLPESEQLGTVSLRGEDIIRGIERQQTEGQWVEVPAACIRSAIPKGLTLTFPEEQIPRVFLSPEDVRMDAKSCQVRLYDHWTYSKGLTGAELKTLLAQRPKTVVDALWRRYRTYERRQDHQRTKSLAETLRFMEREDISGLQDFTLRRQSLRGEQEAVQSQIRLIQQKQGQYAMAYKHLLTVRQFEDIHEQVAGARGFARRRLEKRYRQELDAYETAADSLKAMNVHLSVEPEKVQGLMDHLSCELHRFRNEAERLDRQSRELDAAEHTVRQVTEPQKEQKNQRKTR